MKKLIPLLIGLAALPAYAQVQKLTDASGKVHSSERPQDAVNAKEQPVQRPAQPALPAAEDWHRRELDSRERRMQREAANQEAEDAVVREKHHLNMNRRH